YSFIVTSFCKGGHRVRQVTRLSRAAPLNSVEAAVVRARHCNSVHVVGQKLIQDMDGNFISQLIIPVALIMENAYAA
ncbi:MAG: hypothetical protein KKC20_20600, partial [Proteobacteria bacterium]|nr:hypothetical protein [Pseudomonadota bacterium]